MKFKKQIPYDIMIRPTPNQGFIVEVGCVKVVYSGVSQLVRDLTVYLENPEDVEKQYNKDIVKLDRVHIGPGAPIFSGSALARMTDDVIMAEQRKEAKNNPGAVVYPTQENEL